MSQESDRHYLDACQRLENVTRQLQLAIDDIRIKLDSVDASAMEAQALRQDRARLANALDQSRAREKELELAASDASNQLGEAITEMRKALSQL